MNGEGEGGEWGGRGRGGGKEEEECDAVDSTDNYVDPCVM